MSRAGVPLPPLPGAMGESSEQTYSEPSNGSVNYLVPDLKGMQGKGKGPAYEDLPLPASPGHSRNLMSGTMGSNANQIFSSSTFSAGGPPPVAPRSVWSLSGNSSRIDLQASPSPRALSPSPTTSVFGGMGNDLIETVETTGGMNSDAPPVDNTIGVSEKDSGTEEIDGGTAPTLAGAVEDGVNLGRRQSEQSEVCGWGGMLRRE